MPADKSVPEAKKKEDLAQLEVALKNAKPIQFKENIALVLKYLGIEVYDIGNNATSAGYANTTEIPVPAAGFSGLSDAQLRQIEKSLPATKALIDLLNRAQPIIEQAQSLYAEAEPLIKWETSIEPSLEETAQA